MKQKKLSDWIMLNKIGESGIISIDFVVKTELNVARRTKAKKK